MWYLAWSGRLDEWVNGWTEMDTKIIKKKEKNSVKNQRKYQMTIKNQYTHTHTQMKAYTCVRVCVWNSCAAAAQQQINSRSVSHVNNTVEKLLKLNYSCKTRRRLQLRRRRWQSKQPRPHTHTLTDTHSRMSVSQLEQQKKQREKNHIDAYEKRQAQWANRTWQDEGRGSWGEAAGKSAYPSANRQQIAMWYTVELPLGKA